MQQGKDEILGLQCVHSKAAETFFPNWDEHWIVNDLEDTDLSYRVFCNPDIRVQTFLDECRVLSAIQTDGHVTLLFTVGKRQKFPLCSKANCSKQTKRICFKQYKKLMKTDGNSNYYGDKRSRQKPHFLESIPLGDHHRKHVYNFTKLEYPIKRCPEIQRKLLDRLDGVFNLPERIHMMIRQSVMNIHHMMNSSL